MNYPARLALHVFTKLPVMGFVKWLKGARHVSNKADLRAAEPRNFQLRMERLPHDFAGSSSGTQLPRLVKHAVQRVVNNIARSADWSASLVKWPLTLDG